jgi:molybdopterin-guanine dinucleotide biosynthesis protein A
MRFSGAVLTGGASTRMGRDKAFLAVPGDAQRRPLARIAVDALRAAGASEVLAVGGDPDRLRAEIDPALRTVADGWPGQGPLGGITTALAAAREPIVVVLACDLPHVTAEAVRAVVDAMDGGADAAVPGRHVLLAAYRRTCRTVFEVAMRVGVRAPREALDGLHVADVALADPAWADNANTPADL